MPSPYHRKLFFQLVGRMAEPSSRQGHNSAEPVDQNQALRPKRHRAGWLDTNMKPKISIIMPTFNRAKYIAEAIRSVQSQTLREWELIVIDDGSTDNTESIVRDLTEKDGRISYFKNERNLGIAKTRNRGVSLAKADYVAMLDSDDKWISSEKLVCQLETIEKNMKLGIVGTNACFIDEDGAIIEKNTNFSSGNSSNKGKCTNFPSDDAGIRQTELYRNILMQSGLLIKKEAIEKAGGYDSRFTVCDDHDLWLKIGKNWQFMILPSVDLSYRIHKSGITKAKHFKTACEEMKILFKFRKEYPGFFKGLIKCTGRFFI
jgi:glycosyltransferase involved in cell wall biosynthesis